MEEYGLENCYDLNCKTCNPCQHPEVEITCDGIEHRLFCPERCGTWFESCPEAGTWTEPVSCESEVE